MPPRKWLLRLEDILTAIERIETSLDGLSFDDFERNPDKIDATVRNLTVIGEAANHVPKKITKKFPNVPWIKAIDLRNFIVHEYFGITLSTIWATAQDRLPELKKEIGSIVEQEQTIFKDVLVSNKNKQDGELKVHPWRLCPAGQHWVVTHPLHMPPSKEHPGGLVTTRHEHCAHNPSGKDQLYPPEIGEMSKHGFPESKNKPCPLDLGFKGKGDKYDDLISGWTQYWNEVLKPSEPLRPDVVKALIASESGFIPDRLAKKSNPNSARGLAQITNDARKTLGNEKGELKDHFVSLTRQELNDPSNNICAGIRWLFQKRKLASGKLGREASWEEAVANYKGVLDSWRSNKEPANKQMGIFSSYLEKLKQCKKS